MKKKSALLVSVSMVLVAILALTTSSFAWFSASMNPSLGGFDINVTTAEALLVGVLPTDGAAGAGNGAYADIKYKTSLDIDEILTAKNGVFVGTGEELAEVTPKTVAGTPKKISASADKDAPIDFYQLQSMNVPEFAGDGTNDAAIYKAADNATTTKRFVKFDLYFKANFAGDNDIDIKLAFKEDTGKVDNISKFVALDPTAGTELVYDADAGKTDADQPKVYWITTAMRTAFVATKVTDANGTLDALEAPKVLEIDNRQPAHIVAPSVDAHRAYTPDATYRTGTGAGVVEDANDMALFTMPNDSVYRLTVYLWIEGNDLQCYNQISASRFLAQYAFVGVQQTNP